MGEHHDSPPPPLTRDPSLEIPEILRTPVRQSQLPGAPLPGDASMSGVGVGFAMAFDFIGSIGAGVVLGWLFDRWQSTRPIGILVGLGLGFAGALIRIMRQASRADKRDTADREASRASYRSKQ